MELFKVGKIAKEVGINVETLRYYEKIKLMPKPKRIESRYRIYDVSDLRRLRFIVRAKELGFTLKEIHELLSLKIEKSSTCGDVKHIAEHKLDDIKKRISDLNSMKNILEKLIDQCTNEELLTDECPILEVIDEKFQ